MLLNILFASLLSVSTLWVQVDQREYHTQLSSLLKCKQLYFNENGDRILILHKGIVVVNPVLAPMIDMDGNVTYWTITIDKVEYVILND